MFVALLGLCWNLTFGTLNTRSVAEPIDDDDNVELDKSNVLLMGPTGSGMTSLCFLSELVFICALPALIIYMILDQNREDITRKDTSSTCKCSVCHC